MNLYYPLNLKKNIIAWSRSFKKCRNFDAAKNDYDNTYACDCVACEYRANLWDRNWE